jgi:hypothetical protein
MYKNLSVLETNETEKGKIRKPIDDILSRPTTPVFSGVIKICVIEDLIVG